MTPEEFYNILHGNGKPVQPARRLYYDASGLPLLYTMEDLPGDWIEVDALTYAVARTDIRVKDGIIIELPKHAVIKKLHPGEQGICSHPRDICLIVSPDHPHIKWTLSTNG